MILIADGGSTKTHWCVTGRQTDTRYFFTEGYNPYYITEKYLVTSLKESLIPGYNWDEVEEVHFYGAGCAEDKYDFMRNALSKVFRHARIFIAMDLLAAARALLGRNAGFAAILGTGTNSCLYDGNQITHNIDSLGFILGDEGSGGYIGKKLVCDYIRGEMPEEVGSRFRETYRYTADELIDRIYTQPMANRFCAGFCKFITSDTTAHPYLIGIVRNAFEQLFEKLVCRYPAYETYSFNCVGSVAYYFRDILAEVAEKYQMTLGHIVISPMEGLVHYHTLTEKQEV